MIDKASVLVDREVRKPSDPGITNFAIGTLGNAACSGYDRPVPPKDQTMSLLTAAPPIAYVLTRDRPRAKIFYAETLGLPITGENFFATIFDLNGTALYLTTVADHVPHPHAVLGWAVPDIAATL